MANILYGDSSEEKTIFNDSKVSELVIRNIYAATDSKIAGYKKESNGSLFYYVNKYNARNAGYISADFHQPASLKPSTDIFDVCFHTEDEFSAETRDASLKFSRTDDFDELNADHYSYISDRILYNIEQGSTVFIKLKDAYDNMESISKELSFAQKLLSAFPEYLQKEISFVCNARDNKGINANIVFVYEGSSVSGGTVVDCREQDCFKAVSRPYSVYLSKVIAGIEPKDEGLEEFYKKYINERFLKNGNKIKNPFSDLFVLYKFDGNPEQVQTFSEHLKEVIDRYGNCLKNTDEFKDYLKSKIGEDGLRIVFPVEIEVQSEPETVPENINEIADSTSTNTVPSEAESKEPVPNDSGNQTAQNNPVSLSVQAMDSCDTEGECNDDSVPENSESDVMPVEQEKESNIQNCSTVDDGNNSAVKSNEAVKSSSFDSSKCEKTRQERIVYGMKLSAKEHFPDILEQWKYFYEDILKIDPSIKKSDVFLSSNPINPSNIPKIDVEDPSLIYKLPENINEVNNKQLVVIEMYKYYAALVFSDLYSIITNQRYENEDIYKITAHTYVCKMIFDCYRVSNRNNINNSNVKLEKIMNLELTDVKINYPELMFNLVIDCLTIQKSLLGNSYRNYRPDMIINTVIYYCTIDYTKKECISRFLKVIDEIDQTNALRYSMKYELRDILKKMYGSFYDFDNEN